MPIKTPVKRVHSAYPPGRGGPGYGNNQGGGGGKGGNGGNPGNGGGGGGKGLSNTYNPRTNTLTGGKSTDGISSIKGGGSQYHAPGGNHAKKEVTRSRSIDAI